MSELETVIAGDTLIIDSRQSTRIATVDRVTKTQIVIGHSRYRKRDGQLVGNCDRWSFTRVRRPKNDGEIIEIQNEERRRTLAHRIAGMCELHRIRDMSLEVLEGLNDAVRHAHESMLEEVDG